MLKDVNLYRAFLISLSSLVLWSCLNAPLLANEQVTLSAEDIKILKTIDSQEKAAGVTQHILAWSPLVALAATDNIADFVFTFVTTNFEDHAKSVNAIEKIKACSILQVIDLHLISHEHNSAYDFFTNLKTKYDPFCA